LVDALICYKQKCKVASFNLAHPVYTVGPWLVSFRILVWSWCSVHEII